MTSRHSLFLQYVSPCFLISSSYPPHPDLWHLWYLYNYMPSSLPSFLCRSNALWRRWLFRSLWSAASCAFCDTSHICAVCVYFWFITNCIVNSNIVSIMFKSKTCHTFIQIIYLRVSQTDWEEETKVNRPTTWLNFYVLTVVVHKQCLCELRDYCQHYACAHFQFHLKYF